jgi:nucleotide-binding universal stress UspA family protein
MFERIVVAIKGEDAGRDALALTRELAPPHGEVTLVHVLVVPDKPAPDSAGSRLAAKHTHVLETLTVLATEFAPGARVSCVEAASVRRGLHGSARDARADLLVIGATREDELARELVGDDARRVLTDAPCAVAVAPVSYAARATTMRRIGVAYNGSPESTEALGVARSLAHERRAHLSAFEAVRAPLYVHDPWNADAEIEDRVEEARRQVVALGGLQAQAGCGDRVDELAHYGESVDLLVVGSHRYGPLDRLTERTTSQRLADTATTPIVVLPRTEKQVGRSAATPRR